MGFTRDFLFISKNDAYIAGGKGASLGELTSAGIPVPPGFVVLSSAFEQFLKDTDLSAEIDSILHTVKHTEMHTVEYASEKIQALIQSAKMPDQIAREIVQEFRKLGAEYVAVRSSATAEDSSSAAWAGQLDSFLNTTDKTLLINVQKCWASLFTPRAIFYRFEKQLHSQKISVAVVVQKMIQSEKSGIAFSVHPVTEDRNQLIIEAGYGLGEAIVSGQITPDSYVVEKNPRRVIERHVVTQERGLYRSSSVIPAEAGIQNSKQSNNQWQSILPEKGSQQKLTDGQILELTELILKIEKHYGFPCDIEWAFEKGKFYITQSRPITTLKKDTHENADTTSQKIERYLIAKYDIHPPLIHKGLHATFYPADFVQLLWNKWGDYSGFYYKLHISALQNDYWDIYYLPDEFTKLRNHYFANLKKNKNYLQKHYHDWRDSCQRLNGKISVLESALAADNFPVILSAYQDFVEEYIFEYALACAIQEACGFQPEQWITPELEAYVKKYGLDYNATAALLTSPVVHSFITQEEIDRLDLAIQSKTSHFDKLLLKHQQKWFWIQNNYADIQVLDEDFFREKVFKTARLPEAEIKVKVYELETAPENTKRKKEDLFKKYHPSLLLKEYIGIVEKFAEMQDVRKAFVLRANHYHKLFLEKVSQKFREPLSHLWFYSWGEISKAIKTHTFLSEQEIEKRKKMIVAVESKEEKVILSGDGAYFFYNHLQEDVKVVETFSGIVAQTGKMQGRVKIVLKSNDIGKVSSGDVLVSSMTRPEMTPAMKIAGAFVTDEGGLTSHAAIVSRELGIPCILGTKIATKVLHDGDLVEVDADEGVVRLLERADGGEAGAKVLNEIPDVKNEDIVYFGQRIEPYFASAIVVGGLIDEAGLIKKFKLNKPVRWFVRTSDSEKHNYDFFNVKSDIDDFTARVKEKIKRENIDYINTILTDCIISGNNLVKFAGDLRKSFSGDLEKRVSGEVIAKFYEQAKDYCVYYSIAFFEKPEMEITRELAEKYSKSEEEKNIVLELLTNPNQLTATDKEQEDFLKLAIHKFKTEKEKQRLAAKHADKYGWLAIRFFIGDWWSKEDVLQRLESQARDKALQAFTERSKRRHERERRIGQLIKRFTNEERMLAKQIRTIVFLRTERADFFNHASAIFKPFLVSAARHLGVSYHDLLYFSPLEVRDALHGKFDIQSKLGDRKKESLIYFGEKVILVAGEDARRYVQKRSVFNRSKKSVNEITGLVACKGVVRGLAKIVLTNEDSMRVGKGDILVATMTTPNFTAAMEKAAAFVTDEGGVISHAAIIAREMRKPCIIGTKIATQVLKDGDLVEVDADAGAVRVLERASDARKKGSGNEEIVRTMKVLSAERWYPQGLNVTPLLILSAADFAGIAYTCFVFDIKDDYGYMLYRMADLKRMANELLAKLKQNPNYFVGIKKKHELIMQKSQRLFTKIQKTALIPLSDGEFLSLLRESSRAMSDSVCISHIIEPFVLVADKKIKAELRKYIEDSKKLNAAFVLLTTPLAKSFAQEAYDDLVRIASAKDPDILIKNYLKNYYWLRNSYLGRKPLTYDDVLKEANEIKHEKSINTNLLKQKGLLLKKLGLPKELGVQLEALEFLTLWQDERKKNILMAIEWLDLLLEELSRRVNISINLLRYLTPFELNQNMAAIKALAPILAERRKGGLYLKTKGRVDVASGALYEQLAPMFAQKQVKTQGDLHGEAASLGNVVGRVKVCLSVNSLAKVEEGDILVTSMTRPEYMPAMKKAAAFVTDEGGITCHAAIIAREMGKPCVIGTRNATKVLKDGDLVEVKGNHGVVKIL